MTDTSNNQKRNSSMAVSLLDDLIATIYAQVKEKTNTKPTVGEMLKMIEMRLKLQPDEDSQAELWEKIERIRQKYLTESADGVLVIDEILASETEADNE